MNPVHIAAVGLAALLIAGCAFEAPRMAPARAAPQQPAEEGLWEISRKFEEAVAMSGRKVDDPDLEAYLQDVGCRVAGPYCDGIRVYPVAAPDFNASMSPNGFMQVWTGLLLRVENEAQLAAVLGHEVMHYAERHSLERLETTRRTANLLLAVQFGLFAGGHTGFSSGPVRVSLGDVTNLVAGGYLAAYSREHEEEADREGLRLMQTAGYHPGAAARVWQNLVAEQEACKLPRPAALLASHPPSTERMAYLDQLAGSDASGANGEQQFLDATLAYRGRWLRAELALRHFCRVRVVAERLLERGANPGELHYYLGEVYRLRNEPGDLDKAIEAYESAISAAGAPPEAHRELGLVLQRANRDAEARAAFQAYLDRVPGSDDAAMVRAYLAGAG